MEPRARVGARAGRAPQTLAVHELDLRPLHALEGREVVLLAHVDAVDRARVDAERAEEALRVVDLVRREDLLPRRRHALDLDAVDRAGLRAQEADDALVGLELVEPALEGREVRLLLGVLDRRRLREEVAPREAHADGRRLDALPDAGEVAQRR